MRAPVFVTRKELSIPMWFLRARELYSQSVIFCTGASKHPVFGKTVDKASLDCMIAISKVCWPSITCKWHPLLGLPLVSAYRSMIRYRICLLRSIVSESGSMRDGRVGACVSRGKFSALDDCLIRRLLFISSAGPYTGGSADQTYHDEKHYRDGPCLKQRYRMHTHLQYSAPRRPGL